MRSVDLIVAPVFEVGVASANDRLTSSGGELGEDVGDDSCAVVAALHEVGVVSAVLKDSLVRLGGQVHSVEGLAHLVLAGHITLEEDAADRHLNGREVVLLRVEVLISLSPERGVVGREFARE